MRSFAASPIAVEAVPGLAGVVTVFGVLTTSAAATGWVGAAGTAVAVLPPGELAASVSSAASFLPADGAFAGALVPEALETGALETGAPGTAAPEPGEANDPASPGLAAAATALFLLVASAVDAGVPGALVELPVVLLAGACVALPTVEVGGAVLDVFVPCRFALPLGGVCPSTFAAFAFAVPPPCGGGLALLPLAATVPAFADAEPALPEPAFDEGAGLLLTGVELVAAEFASELAGAVVGLAEGAGTCGVLGGCTSASSKSANDCVSVACTVVNVCCHCDDGMEEAALTSDAILDTCAFPERLT